MIKNETGFHHLAKSMLFKYLHEHHNIRKATNYSLQLQKQSILRIISQEN